MIRHLPRVVPEAPDKPTRGSEDHPMRKVTRQVAFEPGGWTGERRGKVETLFDELAPEWHTREHPYRTQPLIDAFERGDVGGGVCLELGSGTGIATPWLVERFSLVLAVELSAGMLELAPAGVGTRMRADGSRLPLRDGSIDAAVLVNMFLFPAEMARVIAPTGVLVWVNTSGADTPIHLPADEVDAAMPGDWSGVASEAGWGTWAVLRRA